MRIDLNKTLTQLENNKENKVLFDSYLVTRIQELRKIPLEDFSIEDLRIMIGQDCSLDILIPIAIEKLNENILSEGDFYAGDLLRNILLVDVDYWKKNKIFWLAIMKMYEAKKRFLIQVIIMN